MQLRRRTVLRLLASLVAIVVLLGAAMAGVTFWNASSTILHPPGPGDVGTLDGCREETRKVWGDDCGRLSHIQKEDFSFASPNGYSLSGWIVPTGSSPSNQVVLYVPGGGSDRREASRYHDLLGRLGLDLAVFDPVCQGLSPCPVTGLSYGARESIDVAAAVAALELKYRTVIVMGSSMGALTIIRALPHLKSIRGAVLENPMLGLEPLLRDAEQSRGMPDAAIAMLAGLAQWRGNYPKVPEAMEVLDNYDGPPLLFIHSRSDRVVPPGHSQELASRAGSAATTWFPENGDHGAVWNANSAEFEARVRAFLLPLVER